MYVDKKTVSTRNHAGNNTDPRPEQNAAGHNGDSPHVNQRAFNVYPRKCAENRKQRENRGDRRQFQRRMIIIFFVQQFTEQRGTREEEQTDEHQRRTVKDRQQHIKHVRHGDFSAQ